VPANSRLELTLARVNRRVVSPHLGRCWLYLLLDANIVPGYYLPQSLMS
jgi:hypothetical protein